MDFEPIIHEDNYCLGKIKWFDRTKYYGFITDTEQNDYFVLGDNCRMPGGHLCFLRAGVEVTFVPSPSSRHPGKWDAKTVQLKDANVEVPDREEARITDLGNHIAWGLRACGCQIFVYEGNIRSNLPRPLQIGDEIIFTAVDNAKELFDAREIDVVIPSEKQQENQGGTPWQTN